MESNLRSIFSKWVGKNHQLVIHGQCFTQAQTDFDRIFWRSAERFWLDLLGVTSEILPEFCNSSHIVSQVFSSQIWTFNLWMYMINHADVFVCILHFFSSFVSDSAFFGKPNQTAKPNIVSNLVIPRPFLGAQVSSYPRPGILTNVPKNEYISKTLCSICNFQRASFRKDTHHGNLRGPTPLCHP